MRARHLGVLGLLVMAAIVPVALLVGSRGGKSAAGPLDFAVTGTADIAAQELDPSPPPQIEARFRSLLPSAEAVTAAAKPPAPKPEPLAGPIAYGESFTAEVRAGDQRLHFRFDGAAGDLVRIRAIGAEAMDPVVWLLDPNGAEIATNDDESSVNLDSLMVVRLSADGPHTIRVGAFDGAVTGPVTVSLERLTESPPELRNAGLDEAIAVEPGSRVEAVFSLPEEQHRYRLEAKEGQRVILTADGAVGVDTYAEVFAPDGEFLLADDDSGHGLDAELDLRVWEDGVYEIVVATINQKIGPYTLVVSEPSGGVPPRAIAEDVEAAAHTYIEAVRQGDAVLVLGLTGPEALALWGWQTPEDVQRSLPALQAIGLEGEIGEIRTVLRGGHGRTTLELLDAGGLPAGAIRVDLLRLDGQWRVEYVQRAFQYGLLDTPAPASWKQPPIRKPDASRLPRIDALAAIVIDEASGAILYERDADRALAPASVTKIATAIYAIEHGDLDQWITVEGGLPGGSSLGLRAGDRFTLRDLLYGMMLKSGNDAATTIARAISGSQAVFMENVNSMLSGIGLHDTYFTDPHGLGSREHRTTAHDLGMLARYAMQNAAFRQIVGTPTWTADGSREIMVRNGNALLTAGINVDGVKTGFTSAAGPTYVSTASRGGHRIFVVVLNSPDRFGTAVTLFDWAFANHCWPQLGGGYASADGRSCES